MTISLKHAKTSTVDDSGNTTLVQPSDWNDEHVLQQATSRILGRVTAGAGATEELTAAQVRTLINVEDGATADQTGAEIKAAYEAEADTNAYTDAEKSKLAGIEASADVTDATNVAAAGAVMDGDFSTNGLMKRTGAGTYGTATADTDYQSVPAEGAFADGDKTKLDGIEAGAQVNTVDSVNGQTGTVALDADDIDDSATTNKFTTAGDISKLAGIEASADVTDATNVGAAIAGATAKSTIVDADSVGLIDSADSNSLKETTFTNIWTWVMSKIAGVSGKTTPVDADSIAIVDSEASNVTKRLTFANLWVWVKAKLVGETIYVGTGSGTGLDVAGDGDLAVRIHGDSYVAMQFESYRDSSAGHCRFQGIGGRGTEASPGQTQSGDGLFWIAGRGIDENGSNTNDVAAIRINADGTVSSTSYAGEIEFATCPSGSTGTVTRMGIRNDGQIDFPGLATTASAANAFLDSGNNNELLRSTSKLSAKFGVETVEPQYSKAIIDVRGIYYRSLCKADNPEWAWWGFAAEEVAEVDPRMVHWGYGEDDYDLVEVELEPAVEAKPAKKNRLGRVVEPAVAAMPAQTEVRAVLKENAVKSPQGVMYERFVVHHQVIIKEQQGRIEALEDKNDALNETVATLTARIDALEARLAK